jgi:hypothetical protein
MAWADVARAKAKATAINLSILFSYVNRPELKNYVFFSSIAIDPDQHWTAQSSNAGRRARGQAGTRPISVMSLPSTVTPLSIATEKAMQCIAPIRYVLLYHGASDFTASTGTAAAPRNSSSDASSPTFPISLSASVIAT